MVHRWYLLVSRPRPHSITQPPNSRGTVAGTWTPALIPARTVVSVREGFLWLSVPCRFTHQGSTDIITYRGLGVPFSTGNA